MEGGRRVSRSSGVPIVGRERPTFFRAYSYYNRTGGNDDDERLALCQSFAQCFSKLGLRQAARNAREIWVHPGRKRN